MKNNDDAVSIPSSSGAQAETPASTNSAFDRRIFAVSVSVVAIAGVSAALIGSNILPAKATAAASQSTTRDISSPLLLPRPLADFRLVERSGRTISRADLAGKFLVVDFVFTSCSLKCRVVNDRMAEIQRLVADAPDVRLVSLTVDPRSDTPAVLTKFANSFNADPNRWLFLTGDKAEIRRLIETSFIPSSPELEQIIPGGFMHTDRIMLVDPQGNVYASFNGLKSDVAAAVVVEIKQRRHGLMSRQSNPQ